MPVDAAEQLLALVPRAVTLVGQLEQLVGRVTGIVDRIDRIADDAQAVVGKVDAVADDVPPLVDQLAPIIERVRGLVDELEPALLTLQPTLDKLAETTSPEEVEALVGLVDQLPELTQSLRDDILPILGTMDHVSGDLHDLMLLSRELNEMLAGVPGVRRLLTRSVGNR